MKKIINGKLYNTKTAIKICLDSYSSQSDYTYCEETLYQTKKGTYFIAGEGGAGSKYGKRVGQNSWGGSCDIKLVNKEEAKEFVSKIDVEKTIELFGSGIEEG